MTGRTGAANGATQTDNARTIIIAGFGQNIFFLSNTLSKNIPPLANNTGNDEERYSALLDGFNNNITSTVINNNASI
ncbi:MAG: hypothetical protein WB779_06570, partial [Ignavibacteriaceae bacterium]